MSRVPGTPRDRHGPAVMFARRGRLNLSSFALVAVACGDSAVNPNAAPIGAADVDAMNALVGTVNAMVAEPAVVALGGVTVPYHSTGPGVVWGAASRSQTDVQTIAARRATAALLGEADLPARFLGGTYVRSGGTFGRDPARPGAPDNGVRVLLYHRVGGVSTDSGVGLLEIVDSLRQAARDVTTGVVRALDGVPVVALRSEVKRVGPAGSAALHDVIDGTLGRGSAPIAVLDSFVIDALSPTNGRNVVMTSISALGAPLLRSTPARPGGVGSSLLLEVTVGGRRVLLEGSRNLSTGPHVLFVYVNGVEVGRVDTGDLAHLGRSATG